MGKADTMHVLHTVGSRVQGRGADTGLWLWGRGPQDLDL